jgi:phage baseplate assembly protein W
MAVPLRRINRPDGTGGHATVDEGSPEEVSQCVYAVANTPTGHRIDLPEFGTSPAGRGAHRRGGVDAAALERAIALWEPRADLSALRESGALALLALEQGVDNVMLRGA